MKFFLKITLSFFILFTFLTASPDSTLIDKESIKKNPKFVKKISFIPGAGQFYNEDYLKGSLIILSEVYTLSMANKFSSNIIKRNSFIWWSLGIYTLNIIDAYVDAELSSFPNEDDVLKEEKE